MRDPVVLLDLSLGTLSAGEHILTIAAPGYVRRNDQWLDCIRLHVP